MILTLRDPRHQTALFRFHDCGLHRGAHIYENAAIRQAVEAAKVKGIGEVFVDAALDARVSRHALRVGREGRLDGWTVTVEGRVEGVRRTEEAAWQRHMIWGA